MKRIAIVLLLIAPLAACDTRPIEQLGYAERQQLANEITARCVKLGIDPRSRQMEACQYAELEKEMSTREEWRNSNAAAAEAMSEYGARQQAIYTARQPIRCSSSTLGSSVNTTCY